MKALTLKQLRKAINVVKTAKKFANLKDGYQRIVILRLTDAENYMANPLYDMEPMDPRKVLTDIGYRW